jgi:hypothetical protein
MSYDISTQPRLWAADVSHKLQQVGFLLAEDGLVTVLKKVTAPAVPPVERNHIAGQQSPHDR